MLFVDLKDTTNIVKNMKDHPAVSFAKTKAIVQMPAKMTRPYVDGHFVKTKKKVAEKGNSQTTNKKYELSEL